MMYKLVVLKLSCSSKINKKIICHRRFYIFSEHKDVCKHIKYWKCSKKSAVI